MSGFLGGGCNIFAGAIGYVLQSFFCLEGWAVVKAIFSCFFFKKFNFSLLNVLKTWNHAPVDKIKHCVKVVLVFWLEAYFRTGFFCAISQWPLVLKSSGRLSFDTNFLSFFFKIVEFWKKFLDFWEKSLSFEKKSLSFKTKTLEFWNLTF